MKNIETFWINLRNLVNWFNPEIQLARQFKSRMHLLKRMKGNKTDFRHLMTFHFMHLGESLRSLERKIYDGLWSASLWATVNADLLVISHILFLIICHKNTQKPVIKIFQHPSVWLLSSINNSILLVFVPASWIELNHLHTYS